MKRGTKKRTNNPMNVNQYTLPDPRQALFLSAYLDIKSETFSNALQSALKAGYEENYAKNITVHMPKWLVENLGKIVNENMMRKVNRNFDKYLDYDEMQPAMGAFGPIYEKVPIGKKVRGKKQQFRKVKVMRVDTAILNTKLQATKFVAETIGRNTYSKQTGNGDVSFNLTQINADRERFK